MSLDSAKVMNYLMELHKAKLNGQENNCIVNCSFAVTLSNRIYKRT